MIFPPHLSPEDKYKRLIYIGSVAVAQPVETFAGWTVTGLAAMTGLILTHLDTIQETIQPSAIRWGIILLVFAMLLGTVTKYLGILIRTGVAVSNSVYHELYSPEGVSMLNGLTTPADQLIQEVAKSYLWPFRQLLERLGRKGLNDPLNAEKRYIKMLCVQSYLFYGMCVFAAVAIAILSCGFQR